MVISNTFKLINHEKINDHCMLPLLRFRYGAGKTFY
jgi:hypothetical protein